MCSQQQSDRSTRSPDKSWRRAFATLGVLLAKDASAKEIMTEVERELERQGDEAYSKSGERAYHCFRRDLQRLRYSLDCDIRYHRSSGTYSLLKAPFLLRLSAQEIEAMATIDQVFGPSMPSAAGVQMLLARWRKYLDDRQIRALESRGRIAFQSVPIDDVGSLEADITRLQWAIDKGEAVEFVYRSPSEGRFKRHSVEPWSIFIKDEHYYLRGYDQRRREESDFRIDRISPGSVRLLPGKLEGRRPRRELTLRYIVSPALARYGVTKRFPNQQQEAREDGSVLVTATISNTFEAVQTLLRYGGEVECLDPPEVRSELTSIASALAKIYSESKSK